MTPQHPEQAADGQAISEDPTALDDGALLRAIDARRQALAVSERAYIQARERLDAQRRRLRGLEAEQERRRLAAAGIESPAIAETVRRKRSTTGMDALLGRDGIEPDRPFSRFRIRSLQRQEVLLNHTGDRDEQSLGFVDPATGSLHEARNFGEARRMHEQGYTLGRPGVPLQRQAILYVADARAGWLRLDQLFVEQDWEED